MIIELLYASFAVENVDDTRRAFRDVLGLGSEHMGPDPFLGTTRGALVAFPNRCWLYLMESDCPNSPVFQHLGSKGAGLERLAFRTDNIDAAFERVRRAAVPLADDALVTTPEGRRFAIPPEHIAGVRVELIQPSPGCWVHDAPENIAGVLGLQHIGIVSRDLLVTIDRFQKLLDLQMEDLRYDQHGGQQKDVIIRSGNDRLWLHAVESWEPNSRVLEYLQENGEGLDHICIEVDDIRESVKQALGGKCSYQDNPFRDHKIFTSRPDGFEAFILPQYTTGLTVELIEPFPFSRGYRERKK